MYRYQLAGLNFASVMPLPDLGPELPARPSQNDVLVQPAKVPKLPGGPAPEGTIGWFGETGCCLLDVARVGRFELRDGRHIGYERTGELGDEVLRLYLLGSVLGALWHQRGRLPLHAGALAMGGRAWAFVGNSGAGKSSLVVTLAATERVAYLCDDVCVLDVATGGSALAWPGLARMRLSPALCALLGFEGLPDLSPTTDAFGKRALTPPWERPLEPLPLAGVVVLEVDGALEHPEIERLGATGALAALLAHTYRREYIPVSGRAAHFAQCSALVRSTPVYRLRRPWGMERIQEDAQRIQELLVGLPDSL